MKRNHICITMLLAVFAFVSCVKEFENEGNSQSKGTLPIEFTISDDATRTLPDLTDGKSVVWEDGDRVGLYYRSRISGDSNVDTFVADNVPYEYDAQTGKFVPVGEPATWDGGESGDNHAVWIYYPYSSEAVAFNNIPVTIPSATTYDVAATSNPVASCVFSGTRIIDATYGAALEFPAMTHSFAMFRLNITNLTGEDVIVNKVVLSNDSKNLAGKCNMSMASYSSGAPKISGTPSANASKQITVDVENGILKAGECIDVRMVMLPGDYTGTRFTVSVTSDKGEHPAVDFDGGNIAIGGRASKSIVLQATEGSGTPEYTIGSVVSGGVLYKIDGDTGYVLYPYAGQTKWVETMSGSTVGIEKFSNDGREAVAAMKATSGGIANYPAAKYCDDLDGDWYLPSENELYELFDVYTGNDCLDTDAARATFKVKPDALDEKYLNARKAFDGYILACASDGHILNTADNTKEGDVLWTSTTASTNKQARCIRFGKLAALTDAQGTKYARCIKRVNLTASDQPQTEQTYPAPTAGTEGEYDVYLLIGQSNMAGRGELLEEDKAEISNVYLLNSEGTPVAATNPMNIYSSIRKADNVQQMGPGASFASTLAAQTGKKILLVVNARGGTAIAEWAKGATSSITVGNATSTTSLSFYAEAVRRAQQAMEYGALKGIIWHQGCSDQSNSHYMTDLTALATNLRKDIGADVPFIVGQLGDWRSSSKNFNTNIKNVGSYLTYSDWISSAGCVPIVTEDSNGEPDTTDPHFNRASQILIGKRYAQKILKMVYETDYTVE